MSSYEKPDHWSIKAQKEGYPARSVYKLREIAEKFGLLRQAGNSVKHGAPLKVLDIGAAPGSWSLYVLRTSGKPVSLTAADLCPLSRRHEFDGENFHFIQGDITLPEVRDEILRRGPYGLIISDAAPATTGNRSVDTLRSLALSEEVLNYAESGLAPGGNLVVKVFQGGDTAALLKRMRELFKTAKAFKPQACRPDSFETYYLGLEKK